MPTFRLLHASDLHISIIPRKVGIGDVLLGNFQGLPHISLVSSQDPDLLEALAALAYNRRNEIDAILITGDLATTGKVKDLQEAYSFVETPAGATSPSWLNSSGKPTLQAANKRVFLIPGNHDRFKGLRYMPGGDEFDKTFLKYWTAKQSAQILGALPRPSPKLVLIGADFSLRNKKHAKGLGGKWGQGKVYRSVIDKLCELTKKVQTVNKNIGIIWVTHFPPNFPEGDDALDLVNGDALVNAARTHKVSVILTGHTHNPKRYMIPPVSSSYVEVICAGTATQSAAPVGHVVHILEVEVLAAGKTEVHRRQLWWNEDQNDFV